MLSWWQMHLHPSVCWGAVRHIVGALLWGSRKWLRKPGLASLLEYFQIEDACRTAGHTHRRTAALLLLSLITVHLLRCSQIELWVRIGRWQRQRVLWPRTTYLSLSKDRCCYTLPGCNRHLYLPQMHSLLLSKSLLRCISLRATNLSSAGGTSAYGQLAISLQVIWQFYWEMFYYFVKFLKLSEHLVYD